MYCQACGISLSQQMKYCNRCGAQLITSNESAEIKPSEKRLDEYLDGLFWITVFGLGLIFGGMILMKKFQLSDALIVAYLILSSTAFLINFGLSIWEVGRLVKSRRQTAIAIQAKHLDTSELNPANARAALAPASITENTTRALKEQKAESSRR